MNSIPAEQIIKGDTIFIGGYADQPMHVTDVSFAGATRVHVVISSDITFSYRRRERVHIADREA